MPALKIFAANCASLEKIALGLGFNFDEADRGMFLRSVTELPKLRELTILCGGDIKELPNLRNTLEVLDSSWVTGDSEPCVLEVN